MLIGLIIQQNMMCAQDMPDGTVSGDDQLAEQDTCQGDSGSPMILPSKKGDWEQDLQVGVGTLLGDTCFSALIQYVLLILFCVFAVPNCTIQVSWGIG